MRIVNSKYTKYILLFFFALTIFWGSWIMRKAMVNLQTSSGTSQMLDLLPAADDNQVYSYLDSVGNDGRNVLVGIYQFEDFIFPMAYGPFLFLAILYFIGKAYPHNKGLLLLAILPILGVGVDYMENFSIISIIRSYPNKVSLAGMIGTITLVKWILAGSSGAAMIGSFVLFMVKRKAIRNK